MKNYLFYISLFLICGCSDKTPIKTGLEGNLLPKFDLLMEDSVTHISTRDIPAGQSIVLLYFSPNCPYCKAEMTDIIENISNLSNTTFYLISIWPIAELKLFDGRFDLKKYKNIVVGYDYTDFFANYFNVAALPYSAIYKKNRKLTAVFIGNITGNQIKTVIEK